MKVVKYVVLVLLIAVVGCSQSEQENNLELIGHRGATGLAPENTIPGFLKALEHNVDAIELDVVITGDEQVLVSHEPWFRHDICQMPEGDLISHLSYSAFLIKTYIPSIGNSLIIVSFKFGQS